LKNQVFLKTAVYNLFLIKVGERKFETINTLKEIVDLFLLAIKKYPSQDTIIAFMNIPISAPVIPPYVKMMGLIGATSPGSGCAVPITSDTR
jgi:hypothetical protein